MPLIIEGKECACLGDPTSHGSPLAPGPGAPTVLYNGRPVWRVGMDQHVCPLSDGPKPHVGGVVVVGAVRTMVMGAPAARKTDVVVEVGPPNPILPGAFGVGAGDSSDEKHLYVEDPPSESPPQTPPDRFESPPQGLGGAPSGPIGAQPPGSKNAPGAAPLGAPVPPVCDFEIVLASGGSKVPDLGRMELKGRYETRNRSYDPDDGTRFGIGIAKYEWSIEGPDPSSSSASEMAFSPKKEGDYVARLRVTDDEGLKAEKAVPFKVLSVCEMRKAEIDKYVEDYKKMISRARTLGFNVAADNLQWFIDGKGGVRVMSVDWLTSYRSVRDAEEVNHKRFEKTLRDRAAKMADGATDHVAEHWDRVVNAALGGNPVSDLYYASGTSQISSDGTFELVRKGNVVTVSGQVAHRWHDDYDWNPGSTAWIPGFGNFPDDAGILLRDCRGAKDFKLEAKWTRRLIATVDLKPSPIWDDTKFDWQERHVVV